MCSEYQNAIVGNDGKCARNEVSAVGFDTVISFRERLFGFRWKVINDGCGFNLTNFVLSSAI